MHCILPFCGLRMLLLVLFVSTFYATTATQSCGETKFKSSQAGGERIVGGRKASEGEFPWVVLLRERFTIYYYGRKREMERCFCGGSIISEKWILSAAHCFFGKPLPPKRDYTVIAGTTSSTAKGNHVTESKVIRVVTHPMFSMYNLQNDIALLELPSSLDFSNSKGHINKICLPKKDQVVEKNLITVGWGALYRGGRGSDSQMIIELPLVGNDVCRKRYAYFYPPITNYNLCAGYKGGEGPCEGDSGGPLFQIVNGKATVVGIVSWGEGCARQNFPTVFARVSSYVEWIHKYVPQ